MLARTSETLTNIAAAIVKSAAELEDIKKEGSAQIPTKSGGSYSYRYATLPGILQAVRPVLTRHGLAVLQNASEGPHGSVYISTMIVHSSGEFIVLDALPMPMGNTAQETGSAITYGRRYQLLAALGLAADDDDDGATAAPRTSTSGTPFTGTKTITNKMKGKCIHCGNTVDVGEGIATNNGSGWKTSHIEGQCPPEAF